MSTALKLCLLTAAFAIAPPGVAQTVQSSDSPEIIVTGKSIDDTRAALAACLARNCPPDQDIDATLAHVENQFVAGDYKDARTTLLASMKRNGKQAKNYPEPVADLNRANGRVAAHLGFENDYYSSTWGILRALNEGIPKQDVRHFSARLEIAEMMASVRGPRPARLVYKDLAEDARKAGRADIAGLAELRSIWIDYLEFPEGSAKSRLIALSRSADPEARSSALAAKVLLARIARNEGRKDATDALIREMAGMRLKKPTLLYSPRWELAQRNDGSGGNVLSQTAADTFDDKWIDVGYWVQADGRVADLEILRKSGEAGWARPLLSSIAGRIYSPTDPNDDGAYRVERYTYTSRFEDRLGTHIRQRSAKARVEYLDLTMDGPKPQG
jgi:hypothetical protein